MARPSAAERELHALASQLRKVEAEYTMYFSGRAGRAPVESRLALDRAFRQFDRAHLDSPVVRFQFGTLQARYSSFSDLWDRGVRAREEGRGWPVVRQAQTTPAPPAPAEELLHEASFRVRRTSPAAAHGRGQDDGSGQELETLRDLYGALMQARRDAGRNLVPFHRFAAFVRDQVRDLRAHHPAADVAFRVTRRGDAVRFTARVVRGGGTEGGDGDA